MNVSCLFFDENNDVCFAEVLVVASLSNAIVQAQEVLHQQPSYAWFELWVEGKCLASSHDGDVSAQAASKHRGLLN